MLHLDVNLAESYYFIVKVLHELLVVIIKCFIP